MAEPRRGLFSRLRRKSEPETRRPSTEPTMWETRFAELNAKVAEIQTGLDRSLASDLELLEALEAHRVHLDLLLVMGHARRVRVTDYELELTRVPSEVRKAMHDVLAAEVGDSKLEQEPIERIPSSPHQVKLERWSDEWVKNTSMARYLPVLDMMSQAKDDADSSHAVKLSLALELSRWNPLLLPTEEFSPGDMLSPFVSPILSGPKFRPLDKLEHELEQGDNSQAQAELLEGK